jgi:hypothetical protein
MDRAKYMEQLEKKAAAGSVEAMYELAQSLGRSSARAADILEELLPRGHGPAHAMLAWGYEKGCYGRAIDVARARELYGKALALGVTEFGPTSLADYVKKLDASLARVAKATAGNKGRPLDPLAAAIERLGLGKKKGAILAAVAPSIRLRPAPADDASLGRGASKIGGEPDVLAKLEWPEEKGAPLDFLAQIDCGKVAGQGAAKVLPKKGVLSFFYDTKKQPDAGRVVYSPDPAKLARRKAPHQARTLAVSSLAPENDRTLPFTRTREGRALGLAGALSSKYLELLDELAGKGPLHRMLGHADAIQGDMKKPASEWVLLFQMDSYFYGKLLWGDNGRLFFWVRAEDLAQKHFDDVEVVLQSH